MLQFKWNSGQRLGLLPSLLGGQTLISGLKHMGSPGPTGLDPCSCHSIRWASAVPGDEVPRRGGPPEEGGWGRRPGPSLL